MEMCPWCGFSIDRPQCCPRCDKFIDRDAIGAIRPNYNDRIDEGMAMFNDEYEDHGGIFEDGDEYSPWEDQIDEW